MNRTKTQILRLVGAGALAAATSAPALAQSKGDDFDKPLQNRSKAPAARQQGGQSTFMMREQDGDTRYEIRVNGDQVSAKVNGKEVPADRVVREGNEVRLLDEDGKIVHRFTVVTGEGGGAFGSGQAPKAQGGSKRFGRTTVRPVVPVPPAPPGAGEPGQPQVWVGEQPKVMLGINMGSPSETLLKNYGLEPDTAILVDRVVDGLPADRAGIKENDIITEIDGKKPATRESLLEVLKDKEPGDTVAFTVLRKGGSKTIRVKLEARDQAKLAPLMNMQGEEQEEGAGEAPEGWGNIPKEAQDAVREAMRNQYWTNNGKDGHALVFGPNGKDLFIQPQMNEKMTELDKRMAELDERLAKLSEQMAKLEKMMDKMATQRNKD